MTYRAPLQDMLFVMKELAGLREIGSLPGFEDATPETVEAVLEENARFCSEVVAPLNQIGDRQPSLWRDGEVHTTPGFKEAFQAYAGAGWQGLQHPVEFGGQGLPALVAAACNEMLNAANLSFGLCPLLSDGCIEALKMAGTAQQKSLYLEKLISGSWTGTMNLTEPQAGSDLSLVRTRAEPLGDGRYRLHGTKIYITYGEHDMAENIIHMVLARTPNAPEGVKGISLFVVPKFLINDDRSLGARNDVQCLSIEHKLGIKASPTAVLQYGDHGGAIGMMVGEENRGLEYMFVMMNAARFAVGIQGIGLADRARQKAVAYAKDRLQSRDLAGSAGPVAIVAHPDVRRMLMSMRAQTEAARALAYVAAAASDSAHHHPDADVRRDQKAFYEYLVPIVKGWSTEIAVDVASDGVQVHGGMGFIEETGAAQYYRDARILTIYEGTTAIQANDLIGRKTVRDNGATIKKILTRIGDTQAEIAAQESAQLRAIGARVATAAQALSEVVTYVLEHAKSDTREVYAGSVPYLKLAGVVLGGWQMARAALAAERRLSEGQGDAAFHRAKILTALCFADHFLAQAVALRTSIVEGGFSVLALDIDAF
jgi:alkylation response protein AidB-like acyl-CoA dehydrogenase